MARNKLTPRRVISKPLRKELGRALPQSKPRLTPPAHPVTEVFTSETGVRGEVLRLGALHGTAPSSPSDAPCHTHVILLPGNPGLVEYYRPLMRDVFHRLPQDVKECSSLHALGLPGHDVRDLNSTTQFSINDHVEYCRSYLCSEELSTPLSQSNVIFMGHSYGSFLALKLLETLGKGIAERASFAMLMPALHQMGECAGPMARFLVEDTCFATSWAAWAVTACTPPILREVVVRAMGHDASVVDITHAMLDGRRRGLYLNICSLARDEVRSILEPSDLPITKTLAGRSLLLYADNDKWCTPLGRERIQGAFGKGLHIERAGEGVTHAFVLSRIETEKVVRVVAPWISENVRSASR